MSLAILTFSLPDESAEFDNAAHAKEWRSVVEELEEYLHDRIDSRRSKGAREAMRDAHAELIAMIRDRGLVLK